MYALHHVFFKDSENLSTVEKGRKPLVLGGDTNGSGPAVDGEEGGKSTATTTSEGGTDDGSVAEIVSGSYSLKEDACRHQDNLSMFTTENITGYNSTADNNPVKFTKSHHNKYSISSTSVEAVQDGDSGAGSGGNGVTGRTFIKAPFSTPVPAVTPHATPPVTSDNTDKETSSKYYNEKITLPIGIQGTLNHFKIFFCT